jgi:hypothetical protein
MTCVTDHQEEKTVKAEQHHIPPELPDDPVALEHEKRQMANLIPIVVAAVAILFIVVALVLIL